MNVFVFLILFFALCLFAEKYFSVKAKYSVKHNKRRINNIFLLFFVFFVVFYTFRDFQYCSNDTRVYVSSFLQIGKLNYLLTSHPNFENGYLLLIYVVSRLTMNPRVFMLLVGIFIYMSILYFIIRTSQKLSYPQLSSKNIIIAIILFVIYGTFFSSTNLQRQYIAISIILFSHEYLFKKKYLEYYLLVLLAAQFHHSSLICCVLPLLNYVKISKKSIIIFASIVVTILLFSTTIVIWIIDNISYFNEYSGWVQKDSMYVSANSVKIGPLCLFLIYILFIVTLYNGINLNDRYQAFLFKVYCCGLVFMASSIHFSLTDRMSGYFVPFMFPLFANIPKKILFYVCFFVQMLFCLIVNTFRQDWTMFFPYHFM
ncbi:MAG: EpsG family protein [Salinivirgaceae bacterium]|nr:EpsG family protein [Salinivirgaceae bacterium]